jgi:ABC-type transport system involved in multi-copper enzyme maturation permease subunit
MSGSIVRILVLADLHLVRWVIAGSLFAGAVSIAMMPLGAVSAYVGGVSLICVLAILNIMLVMTAIVQERKDKVQLFMLSLPVSTTQYTLAKTIANAVGFVGCWVVLTAAVMAVIDRSALPNGILPFLLAVLVYLLSYYGVLLGVALATDSSAWPTVVITIGNISINFLIPLLLSQPSVYLHRTGPVAVWSSDIVALVAVELAVGLAAVAFGLYRRTRRTDFV